jgi:hypothetical protein
LPCIFSFTLYNITCSPEEFMLLGLPWNGVGKSLRKSVIDVQPTRRYIAEDCSLYQQCRGNIKSRFGYRNKITVTNFCGSKVGYHWPQSPLLDLIVSCFSTDMNAGTLAYEAGLQVPRRFLRGRSPGPFRYGISFEAINLFQTFDSTAWTTDRPIGKYKTTQTNKAPKYIYAPSGIRVQDYSSHWCRPVVTNAHN